MDYLFRKLTAAEVEARVGSNKNGGCTVLIYKDARVDMNILDETFGPWRWQCQYKEVKGNCYCGIAIRTDGGEWIEKWDCGKESNTEAEKGEASDAFKRAAFRWGIGRELYTAPFIFIKTDEKYPSFRVSRLEVSDDRKITDLAIEQLLNYQWTEVWSMKKGAKPAATKPATKPAKAAEPVTAEITAENILQAMQALGAVKSKADLDKVNATWSQYFGKKGKWPHETYMLKFKSLYETLTTQS